MRRFRTHVLALLGAMLLISLSLSSAFGAHPTHADNRGGAVSAFVHELLFGSEEEQGEEGEEVEEVEDENEEELSGGDGDNHGQCVQEYARDHLLVGANDTHGWAVVEAAQVTCRDDAGDEEELEVDEDDAAGDEESATARDRGDRGKSAAAHQKAPGKNNADGARAGGQGHGRANGGAHGKGQGRR